VPTLTSGAQRERSPMPQPCRVLRCLTPVLLAGVVSTSAQDFAIRLTQPAAVGERSRDSGAIEVSNTTVLHDHGKELTQEERQDFRYDVTVEVLAVGAKRNPTRLAVTVHQLIKSGEAGSSPLLPEGARLIARREKGATVFERDGQPAGEEVDQALGEVLAVAGDEEPDGDALFGTDQRQRVGASWPLNSERLAEYMKRSFKMSQLKAQDVKGSAKLVATKQLANCRCLEIEVSLEISNGNIDPSSLPPGMTLTSTVIQSKASMLVPAAPEVEAGPAEGETQVIRKVTGTLGGQLNGVSLSGKLEIRTRLSRHSLPVR